MQRNGVSYDKDNQWLSFDALKVVHQLTEVTWGARCSITLLTQRDTEKKKDRTRWQEGKNKEGGKGRRGGN